MTLFWSWTMAFIKAKPSRDTAAALKQSQETSSEFEERFSAMASSAYTLLGVALGGRLGLFNKMAAMEEPWTPQELAEAGDWKERWVWGLAKGLKKPTHLFVTFGVVKWWICIFDQLFSIFFTEVCFPLGVVDTKLSQSMTAQFNDAYMRQMGN